MAASAAKAKALAAQKDLKITVQQAAINKAKKQAAANKPVAAPINKPAPVNKAPAAKVTPSKSSAKAPATTPAPAAFSEDDAVIQKASETGLDPALVKRFKTLQ